MSLFLHYLSLPYLLEGIEVTLQVTALGLGGGLILGLILAGMQLSRFWLLAAFARAYTVIFRGTPLILQMVFAYDALPHIGIKLPAILAAGLALACNEAPFIAEMLRAGVLGVDRGQVVGRSGARHDAGGADAPGDRAAGDPHHDPGVRQRSRQRAEESSLASVIAVQELTLRIDAAGVLDLRFLLDLLRLRAAVSAADRRDQPSSSCFWNGCSISTAPRGAAQARRLPAVASCRSAATIELAEATVADPEPVRPSLPTRRRWRSTAGRAHQARRDDRAATTSRSRSRICARATARRTCWTALDLTVRDRRGRRAAGAQRLRQEHAAPLHQPSGELGRRHDARRRPPSRLPRRRQAAVAARASPMSAPTSASAWCSSNSICSAI